MKELMYILFLVAVIVLLTTGIVVLISTAPESLEEAPLFISQHLN